MQMFFKKALALLLSIVMLTSLVPAQAQGTADINEGIFAILPAIHCINIKVWIEDKDNPGQFLPAERIWVSYKHHKASDQVQGQFSDADGSIALDKVPPGLSVVYLELSPERFPFGEGYQFPEGYIQDEQAKYVLLDNATGCAQLEFFIRLIPEGPPTGSIRMQKSYYPYPIHQELMSTAVMELMVYKGPQVEGAGFIVYSVDENNNLLQYWNATKGLVDSEGDATRYFSDDEGQVLIEGLPEGRYMVREVVFLPGCHSPYDGPDFGFDIINYHYGFRWIPFEVKAGVALNKHTPITNSPAAFMAAFAKVEADSTVPPEGQDNPPPRRINGAQFRVYRDLPSGQREYIAYRNPPSLGTPILSYFTDNPDEAYIFISGYNSWDNGLFYVPGLPVYLPDNQTQARYFLEEVKAAPGYDLPEAPTEFGPENASNPYSEDHIFVENQRQAGSILVRKLGDPQTGSFGLPSSLNNPVGAKFILAKMEGIDDSTEPPKFLISVLTGYDGQGNAQFTEPFELPPQEIPGEGESPDFEQYYRETIRQLVENHGAMEVENEPHSGTLAFTGLKPGDYSVLETVLPPGYKLNFGGYQNEYGEYIHYNSSEIFTLKENQPLPDVTVYNYLPKNTILIHKTDHTGRESLEGAEFIVEVRRQRNGPPQDTLTSFLAAPVEPGQDPVLSDTTPHRFITDENGILVIENLVRNDGDAEFWWTYIVHEVKAPEGYLPLLGIYHPELGSEFSFLPGLGQVRNLGPQQVPFKLKTHKTLRYGKLEAGQFTFDLYQRDEGQPDRLLATTTNQANGDVLFEEAWASFRPGVSSQLVIKERVPDKPDGILYDANKECIQKIDFALQAPPRSTPRIGTRQNGETILSAAAIALMFLGGLIFVKDGVEVPCEFVNEVILDPVAVQIEASKELVWTLESQAGTPELAAGAYSFTLSKLDPEAPGPATLTQTNAADGKLTFPEISFDKEGSYRYLLRENLPAGADPAHYDQRTFEVTVTIEAKETTQGSWSLVPSVSFLDPESGEAASMQAPVFQNKIKPEPDPIQASLELRKQLTGADLTEGQFQFELWQDGAALTDVGPFTNQADGSVVVLTPPLTAPGSYTFQVKEKAGNQEGYTYDDKTIYSFRVLIELENGQLKQGETTVFKDGQPFTGTPVFQNAYTSPSPTPTDKPVVTASPSPAPTTSDDPVATPTPTPAPSDDPVPSPDVDPPTPSYPTIELPLIAKKIFKNGSLKANSFFFLLKDAKGKLLARVGNDADGQVVFPSRTFSKEVTNYLYTITEEKGNEAKVSYDSTVYTVKVTTRAVAGQLEASADILRDGTPYAGQMVFTNQKELPATGDQTPAQVALFAGAAGLMLASALFLYFRRRRSRG